MKALFIASGNIAWASARLRCYWPAPYMAADVVEYQYRHKAELDKYDVLIYQKVFDKDTAAAFRARGKRVFWDVCDPLWWFNPADSREVIKRVDGVVASCENLRADFAEWCQDAVPTYTIPDRMELEAFPYRRVQADVTPVRMIWFGLAGNRMGLYSTIANLERLAANGYPFELTIYDERPDEVVEDAMFRVYHTRWSLDAENEVISSHDLALLPPYPGVWGTRKSNNRSLTAWASGLAVSDGQDYYKLAQLVEDWQLRRVNAQSGYETVCRDYDVRESAKEWEGLLCK